MRCQETRGGPGEYLDFNLRQLHDYAPGAFVDYLNLVGFGERHAERERLRPDKCSRRLVFDRVGPLGNVSQRGNRNRNPQLRSNAGHDRIQNLLP